MADFDMKRGDTAPIFVAQLKDSTGAPVNLAGAAVQFVMREATAATNTTPVIAAPMDIAVDQVNAPGQVSYEWQPGDTDHARLYSIEFVVSWPDGKEQTFPTVGFVSLEVHDDLESHLASLRAFGAEQIAAKQQISLADAQVAVVSALPKLVLTSDADAKAMIARKTSANTAPVLTDADLDQLVLFAHRPGGGYNTNRAAAEGWRWKAARAAGGFTFTADGVQVDKSMIMDHCLRMVDYYTRSGVRSVVVDSASTFGTDAAIGYNQ